MRKLLELTADRFTATMQLALLVAAVLLMFSTGCTSQSSSSDGPPPLTAGTGHTWWNRQEQTVKIPSDNVLPQASDIASEKNSFLSDRFGLPHNPAPPSTWQWPTLDLSFLVVMGGIIGAAVVIVILILVLRRPDFQLAGIQGQKTTRLQMESAKVSELPFDLEVSDEGFLATAKRYAGQGDYNKAIVYLFSYVLVELDHRQLLTLRRGKTNRMLLKELRSHTFIASHFRNLMLTFERVFFGRHQISASDYEVCLRSCEAIAQSDTNAMKVDNKPAPALGTAILFLCATCVFSGCGQMPSEVYGSASEGNVESLASFSAFRKLFDGAGRRSVEVQRLSPRLNRFGTIVWTPDTFDVPTASQCAWINDWLTNNPGSTFIYVGRDYMPGEDYWKEVAEKALPDNRLDYLVQSAHSASTNDKDFISRTPPINKFSRWFVLKPELGRPASNTVRGAYKDDELSCVLKTRNLLVPVTDFSPDELKASYASELRENVNADIDALVEKLELRDEYSFWDDEISPVPERSSDGEESIENLAAEKYQAKLEHERVAKTPGLPTPAPLKPVEDSVLDEIAADGLSDIETSSLLSTEDSVPLVYEVTDVNWPNSKLVVINNASLCCNYALADVDRRSAAMSIIERTRSRSRVAFLTFQTPSLQYSNPESKDPFGLALFTIYPLNIILAHCLMLGFGALVALWPIFGRPQGLTQRGATDFGKHIEAFGQLLRKSKDRAFALRLIGRYHREIRKDNSSAWSKVDEHVYGGTGSIANTNSNPPSPHLQQ